MGKVLGGEPSCCCHAHRAAHHATLPCWDALDLRRLLACFVASSLLRAGWKFLALGEATIYILPDFPDRTQTPGECVLLRVWPRLPLWPTLAALTWALLLLAPLCSAPSAALSLARTGSDSCGRPVVGEGGALFCGVTQPVVTAVGAAACDE